jgi:hypothetical protein
MKKRGLPRACFATDAMPSKSSIDEKAWLVLCCGMLYSPTGEFVCMFGTSYLFLYGELGRVFTFAVLTIGLNSEGPLTIPVKNASQ